MIPHAGVWIREDADIHEPRDLVDKRVGCNSFATNYSVWWRGILAHQYDVPTQRITWVQSVAEHRADFRPPRRFPIELVEGGTRSEALLSDGKIDAATTAGAGIVRRATGVRPLFADPYPEIRAYVQQHGFVPINTVITVSRKAADRHPDVPRLLLDALVTARPQESVAAHSGEPDLYARLEQETGRSLTASGFQANRTAIQTMICYCYEQGIITHIVDPEDRFLLTDS
jgi:4,5-dihydroxyphthalate decarboxylase